MLRRKKPADELLIAFELHSAVNSNRNRSAPIMKMLLAAGARSDVRFGGITWGRGFEWETTSRSCLKRPADTCHH
jgi:hypothetical protein